MRLLQKPAPLAADTDSFHEPQQADFCAGWPPPSAWSGWLIFMV